MMQELKELRKDMRDSMDRIRGDSMDRLGDSMQEIGDSMDWMQNSMVRNEAEQHSPSGAGQPDVEVGHYDTALC